MSWAPESLPQGLEDANDAQPYPEVVDLAAARGITELVHFTRLKGLVGILHTSAVKARTHLPADARVKHVYRENAADRSRDEQWHGYVNLSVTKINLRMFKSSKAWHPGEEWVILVFEPEVLGDPGVVFCTTNNAYPVVHRAVGPKGFEQMFRDRIPWGYYNSYRSRYGRSDNETTDPQAEVLYPHELSLDHFRAVIAGDEDVYESVLATVTNFSYDPEVILDPGAFQ